MTIKKLLVGVALILAAGATATAKSAAQYEKWVNYRFGIHFDLPRGMTPGREPANGDGRHFTSANGDVKVTVYGENNAMFRSVKQQSDNSLSFMPKPTTVTYRRVAKTWYVCSGYSGGKIFYEKAIYHDQQFDTISIVYPKKAAARFNSVAAHIAMSMRYKDVPPVNGEYRAGTARE
jgi:hypothetical protein